MRTINGVECWTEYVTPKRRKRNVYVIDTKNGGRKNIGTITLCNCGFNFEVAWWLFKSQQPLFGRRTTIKECLETIVEHWKLFTNQGEIL